MESTLIDVINGVIFNSSNQDQIMPAWVANAALKELDPDSLSPYRVRLAAIQALKQIARQQLRGKFEPDDDAQAMQHQLFPGLQHRYPAARQTSDGEPIYIKTELMTSADTAANIQRLRSEAGTKLKHADALEQWAFERGLLAA
jgi:hypothetical protein